MIEQMTLQLKISRRNCDSMDRLGSQLESLNLGLYVSFTLENTIKFDRIITMIFDLQIRLVENNLDTDITTIANDIIELILELTFEDRLYFKQKQQIILLIEFIKETVILYISQIATVEQRKLHLDGELSFSISFYDPINPGNFELMELRDFAQLKGAMQCGGFTRN